MSEDADIRLLLRGALARQEPPHRDLAGPAVSIVLARRRRIRTLTSAGSAMAVVAVAAGGLSYGLVGPHHRNGDAGRRTPSSTGTNAPTATSDKDTRPTAWDKQRDIQDRLPALLSTVLPLGYSVRKASSGMPGPSFVLTGPTGTNTLSLSASPAGPGAQRPSYVGGSCVAAGGRCSHVDLPGGTLWTQLKDFPADYGGAGGFKPGTEKTILSFADDYAFVPASNTGYEYTMTLTATQAHPQYVDQKPAWYTGSAWPPSDNSTIGDPAFNAAGALLSPDQFITMVTNPAMTKVGELLDDNVPASEIAIDEHNRDDATIQAAVKPLFPNGISLAIKSDYRPLGDLLMTGPSGANLFSWSTAKQQSNWLHGWACGVHQEQDCTPTDVPGGVLTVTSRRATSVSPNPAADYYQAGTTEQEAFVEVVYEYLPDDPNGTTVQMHFRTQVKDVPWAATAPSGWPSSKPWPPPGRTDEAPFNAGGALLTPEQFLTIAKNPDIAKTVTTVNALGAPQLLPFG